MTFLKTIFTCKSQKQDRKIKVSSPIKQNNSQFRTNITSDYKNVKKRKEFKVSNFLEDIKFMVDNVHYTDEPDWRYIISADWMKHLLDLANS